MKINTCGLIGMGAIGTVYGDMLYHAYGERFTAIASEGRAERLRREGILHNGKRFSPPVTELGEGKPVDLLLVCVKNYQLEEAVRDMAPFVGTGTKILPLLNGITATDRLQSAFPQACVFYGLTVVIDAVRTGREVVNTLNGILQFGKARNIPVSEEAACVREYLRGAGIDARIEEDMIRGIWKKWMLNVGINQVSALTGARYGQIARVPEADFLFIRAMEEVLALAKAAKVDLREEDVEEYRALIETFSPEAKTSMLQDMEAGRKTELEDFSGELLRLAERYGVPAPVNGVLYKALRAGEAVRRLEASCTEKSPQEEEERLTLFQDNGLPKGRVSRAEAHRRGLLHEEVHCWILSEEEEVFVWFQQRSQRKDFAGFYEIAASGHMFPGEQPLEAALRETEEETGLRLLPGEMVHLGKKREWIQIGEYLDREFVHLFLHLHKGAPAFQPGPEVEKMVKAPLSAYLKWLDTGGELPVSTAAGEKLFLGKELFCPHGDEYRSFVLPYLEEKEFFARREEPVKSL